MPDPIQDVEKCKTYLKSVALSSQDPLPLAQFLSDFKLLTGKIIDPNVFGYPDLITFLKSLPDTIQVIGYGPNALVHGVLTNSKTAGIRQLIDKQKTKKKRNRPIKIQVGRFAARPMTSNRFSYQRSYNPPPRTSMPLQSSQRNPPPRTSMPLPSSQRNNHNNLDYSSGFVNRTSSSIITNNNNLKESDLRHQLNSRIATKTQPQFASNDWDNDWEDCSIESPAPKVKSVVQIPETSSFPKYYNQTSTPTSSSTLNQSRRISSPIVSSVKQPLPPPLMRRSVSGDSYEAKLSTGARNILHRTLVNAQSFNEKKRDKSCQMEAAAPSIVVPTVAPTRTTKSFNSVIQIELPNEAKSIITGEITSEELLNVVSHSLLCGPLSEQILVQKLMVVFHKYVHCLFIPCCIQMAAFCSDAFNVVRSKNYDDQDILSINGLDQEPQHQEFDSTILEAKTKLRQLTGQLIGAYQTYLVVQLSPNEDLLPYLEAMDRHIESTYKSSFFSLYRENEICCVRLSSNQAPSLIIGNIQHQFKWYRTQLLTCEMRDGYNRCCRLFLLDFGVELYVNAAILRPLPDNYRSKYRIHLIDIDGVIVDASPEQFSERLTAYIGKEVKIRPSECLRRLLNVSVSEVQFENKLLGDILIDQKICRRGREWARDFILPHQSVLSVKVMSFQQLPIVPVIVNTPDSQALTAMQALLYEKAKTPIMKIGPPRINDVCVWRNSSNNTAYRVKITDLKDGKADITFLDTYDYKSVFVSELFTLPRIEETALPYQLYMITLYMLQYPPKSCHLNVFLTAPYQAFNIDGQYVLQNMHTNKYLNIEMILISWREMKVPELSLPVTFLGVHEYSAAGNKIVRFKLNNFDNRIETCITMARYLINQLIGDHAELLKLDRVTPESPPKPNEVLFCRFSRPNDYNTIANDVVLLNDLCERVLIVDNKLCSMDRATPLFDIPDNYCGLYRFPVTSCFEDDPELRFLVSCAKYLPPIVERGRILNPVDMELLKSNHSGKVNFISDDGGLSNIEVTTTSMAGDECNVGATPHQFMITPPPGCDVDFLEIDVTSDTLSSLSLLDASCTTVTCMIDP